MHGSMFAGWSEFAVVAAVLFTSLISVSQLPSMLPKSFSLGEAAICCQALTIFLLSFTSLFLNKFDVLLQKSEHLKSTPDVIAFMEVHDFHFHFPCGVML